MLIPAIEGLHPHPMIMKAAPLRKVALAPVASIALLAACGGEQACSQADFISMVEARVDPAFGSLSRFCIEQVGCDGKTVAVSDDPSTYKYSIEIVTPEGETATIDGVLATEHYSLNGEGCPPVTANALVVVSASGIAAAGPWRPRE